MSRVLVIGDIHEPVSHPSYLRFTRWVQEKWKTNRVVLIGDVVDHHGISFHAKNPNCPGPRDEMAQALRGIRKWYDVYPKAEVMIGNHDERVHRLASSVGIPAEYIKPYAEVWNTPGWDWKFDTEIDGVHFRHGTNCSGLRPAMLRAQQSCISTVLGHVHSVGGVQWGAGPHHRLFGLDVGCGIDRRAMAMAYGRDFARKPVLGCGVVIDGVGYFEPMKCSPGERFARRKSR